MNITHPVLFISKKQADSMVHLTIGVSAVSILNPIVSPFYFVSPSFITLTVQLRRIRNADENHHHKTFDQRPR